MRSAQTQGHCLVFQSGPRQETIECPRHHRVESMRGVHFHLIVRGPPPRFFFNFERFYVHFNGLNAVALDHFFFLLEKIFLVEWKPNAGQNPFWTVTMFTFFFSMLLLHIFWEWPIHRPITQAFLMSEHTSHVVWNVLELSVLPCLP